MFYFVISLTLLKLKRETLQIPTTNVIALANIYYLCIVPLMYKRYFCFTETISYVDVLFYGNLYTPLDKRKITPADKIKIFERCFHFTLILSVLNTEIFAPSHQVFL